LSTCKKLEFRGSQAGPRVTPEGSAAFVWARTIKPGASEANASPSRGREAKGGSLWRSAVSSCLFLAAVLLPSSPALAATTYPLTLDNCGMTLTLERAPERVVAIKSTAIELLLSLGLADRLIGTGFQD